MHNQPGYGLWFDGWCETVTFFLTRPACQENRILSNIKKMTLMNLLTWSHFEYHNIDVH